MIYRSPVSCLGLPLVDIAIGPRPDSSAARGIATGWIAIGDIACGVIFAFGGLAIGGVSLGGLSVGVLALAGLSIGIWSVGGLAIGGFALGGAAIAVWAATGGVAIAGQYTLGPAGGSEAARAYFESSTFFQIAGSAARHARWLIVLTIVVPVLRVINQRRRSG